MNQAPVKIDCPITLNFAKLLWSQSVGVEMKWKTVIPKIMSMQNLNILIIDSGVRQGRQRQRQRRQRLEGASEEAVGTNS
jgi:hypothetical protein